MYIDCHTHCRDEHQKHKETIAHALKVAEDSGLSGIFDNPNLGDNPVTTKERVLDRFKLARAANSPVVYATYIGLTTNFEQNKEAVETCREFAYKPGDKVFAAGLKFFTIESGSEQLVISELKEQEEVYANLTKLNYQGVVANHCEKKSLIHPELWNPDNPVTHCSARPEEAEFYSIMDILGIAKETGFRGHLHFFHITTPASVNLINSAKRYQRASCGVCPHHLLLEDVIMQTDNGIFYKMNPPLRNSSSRKKLFSYFLQGKIDILESDHAPHSFEEKTKEYLSGIPNLASWPDFTELLIRKGVRQELLEQTAYKNINKIFQTQIPRLNLPMQKGKHLREYVFDPYESLK